MLFRFVSAVELPVPTVADLDLTVPGGGAVADDEVISKAVWHPAHIAVIIVEDTGVALPGPAIMDDDVFPAIACDTGIVNRLADRRREVLPVDTSAAGCRDQVFLRFGAGFLHNDRVLIVLFAEEEPVPFFFGSWGRHLPFDWRRGCGLSPGRLGLRRGSGS